MKRIAIYPGSFDPITNGHIDIVRRSLKLFDEVTMLIAENIHKRKQSWFSVEERVQQIQAVFAAEDRVHVDICEGLIMDYAKEHKVNAVLRGLRASGDFEQEFMMASINRELNPDVETFFMTTGQNLFFVSSSMIKELSTYGGDISKYVPSVILAAMKAKN